MKPLPLGPYNAILADPPWTFKTYSQLGMDRSPTYNTMSIDDICKMEIPASDDCCLFLWVNTPLLPKAFDVIKEWGFTYKTVAFTWVKKNTVADTFFMGLGYWTRANAELCLLATRGHPQRKSRSVRELIVSKRREHSRKPEEVYEGIEALVNGPYLELFARHKRENWTSWGDEI